MRLKIILFLFINYLNKYNNAQEGAFRKNYIVEKNQTWNGHFYILRDEQPFFRVFHETHRKVFRDNPNAGRVSNEPPSIDAQLMEEHGSDQRLREAAKFWHEHNQKLIHNQTNNQNQQHLEHNYPFQRRIKRAEKSLNNNLKDDSKTLNELEILTKSLNSQQRKWMKAALNEIMKEGGGGGGEQNNEDNIQDNSMVLTVIERNQNKSEAKFGHHHLPAGEQKDSATWPWQLWPFMHCLTLECICPLFRGDVSGNQCILPNGKPLQRAIRKEFRTFSSEEMALFLETMRRFKKSGYYSRLGMIHRRSGVHSGPSFFPWHREFLKRLEIVYRSFHPENTAPVLGLPYWDSSLDGGLPAPEDSIMFSDYLLGEADDFGFVTNGLFANWTTMDGRHSFQRMFGDQEDGEFFNEGRIDYVLSQTSVDKVLTYSLPLHTCINYELDDRFLEYSHDYVHYFISGDMQERFSSSNDPIFFMHHGFVDSVWEMWRQKRQTRFQRERDYPRDDGECMPEWHFSDALMPMLQPLRNLDALSNNYTDNMYEYAKRPSCPNGDSEECGNTKFLWCDVKTNIGHPVCLAKVKPGGNCKGFEWSTEICYNGQCLEGRCTRVLEQQNKKYSKYEKQQKQIDKVYEHWHTESFMRR